MEAVINIRAYSGTVARVVVHISESNNIKTFL